MSQIVKSSFKPGLCGSGCKFLLSSGYLVLHCSDVSKQLYHATLSHHRYRGAFSYMFALIQGDTGLKRSRDKMIERYKDTEIQRYRDTEIQRYRDTEVQRYRDTEIQRYRDTDTQRYRDTETKRYRYTEIQR